MRRTFRQIDVFGQQPYTGNPLAVVLDATGLTDETMRRFAVWSNLSECTFVLPPSTPEADYRVRIFSLDTELPFAGHPTLGTARAWLDAGGTPSREGIVVQECGAGLVPVRLDGDRLAFAAPPLVRTGEVDAATLTRALEVLGLTPNDLVAAQWIDNGPGWLGLLLDDVDTLLRVQPHVSADPEPWFLGLIAPLDADAPEADGASFELRAFFGSDLREDPVTGSLNASAAQWLLATGRATAPYVAHQGTALGRRGRIHISQSDGQIWVGGSTHVAVSGLIDL